MPFVYQRVLDHAPGADISCASLALATDTLRAYRADFAHSLSLRVSALSERENDRDLTEIPHERLGQYHFLNGSTFEDLSSKAPDGWDLARSDCVNETY
jgi:hypothetical protein